MDFLKRAKEIEEYYVNCRRYLHENAETGFDLPKTVEFVEKQLQELGYEPKRIGGGVTCVCGKGENTFMLRADMDALPQKEVSGIPFASQNGSCHSCGHDMHTAMLLGAAKILKENEDLLQGKVKFMFQPAEELLEGAKSMISAGILEDPKPDAAMALHVATANPACPDGVEAGRMIYSRGPCLSSADAFEIRITGKEAHGSTPEEAVSALSVAANLVVALQQMISLEIKSGRRAVMTVCELTSGNTSNIIPQEAILQGSIRTYENDVRDHIKRRLNEISQGIGMLWRAHTEVRYMMEVGPTINDQNLTEELLPYCAEIMNDMQETEPVGASEDFSYVGLHIPTFYANIGAGFKGDNYPLHNSHVILDEKGMAYGVAVFCNCAVNWLKNHDRGGKL